jgi:hypothetical protein
MNNKFGFENLVKRSLGRSRLKLRVNIETDLEG